MALDPLAAAADLTARNITAPSGMDADTILAAASDAVRDAAGCPISQVTSTITLVVSDWDPVTLPAGPVTDVASVAVNGTTIDQSTLTGYCWSAGWRRSGDTLIFTGTALYPLPLDLTVTYTHGYPEVPADIVDLVCGIAAIAFAQSDGDYGSAGRLQSVKLGDYSETIAVPPGAESPSPVVIPDAVRERLRARFNTGVAVLKAIR